MPLINLKIHLELDWIKGCILSSAGDSAINQGTNICEVLSSLFKGVKRLFVVTHAIAGNVANNEAGIKDNKEYFLPRSEGEILKIITY